MSTARYDRSALVWGAIFTVLGVGFLLQETGVVQLRAEILLPSLLVVAGAVLLVAAVGGKGPER
jgi:hypothetical protein